MQILLFSNEINRGNYLSVTVTMAKYNKWNIVQSGVVKNCPAHNRLVTVEETYLRSIAK